MTTDSVQPQEETRTITSIFYSRATGEPFVFSRVERVGPLRRGPESLRPAEPTVVTPIMKVHL